MRKMKKNKFYRICAGLLTALLVFTSIPQTFSSAEEDDIRLAEQIEENKNLADTDGTYTENEVTGILGDEGNADTSISEGEGDITGGQDDFDHIEEENNDPDDSFVEDEDETEIKDETDRNDEENAGQNTDATDTVEEIVITPEPEKQKTGARFAAPRRVPRADSTGGGVTIDTSGDGWSTGGSGKEFFLQRSSSTSGVVYDENTKIITATLNLPEGGTDPEAELAALNVNWSANNDNVTFSEQSRTGNQIRVKVTAKSKPDVTDTISVHVTGSVNRQTEGADGTTTSTPVTINYTDSCQVKITKLLLRQIQLDSRLTVQGGVTDLQAGGEAKLYDVTFVPADADNIGEAQPLYGQSTDQTHVGAELVSPDPDVSGSGYKLKLKAHNVGNATIYIKAADIESSRFDVHVSTFSPVPLTGFDVKVSASGGTWEPISVSTPYEIKEGMSTTFRVYYDPQDTTEKEIDVTTDNDLLSINFIGAREEYREYQMVARRLANTDTLDADNCATAKMAVTPKNTKDNIASKEYTIKVRKELHPVTNILVSPVTLELKERGEGNTGSFRVSLMPQNADNKNIILTSDHPIKVRKQGETAYTDLSDSTGLKVAATGVSSGGQSAVCDFEVMALPDTTGDIIITAASDDPGYTGSAQLTVKVTYHSVTGISLSPQSLTLHEAPETGYKPDEDLGVIEAQIDPTEAHDRTIIWEIAPASSNAGRARIIDDSGSLVAKVETEADENTGKTNIKIIGLERGDCVVTAKSKENDSVMASCGVRVTTGSYSAQSIDLLDGENRVINLDTIVMRPNTTLDLKARVNPVEAINADLTITHNGADLETSKGDTADGITPVYISSYALENSGEKVTLRAGGRCDKSINVQIKNPYLELAQAELHYAPDEVSEEAIRRDLGVRFYEIKDLDPAHYENVTNYGLTLVTESEELTPNSANWAEQLSRPGEKKLRVSYTYTEGSSDYSYEKELVLAVSQYPLVDLVRVINPDKVWNIPNGTSLGSMTLPAKVDITVRDRIEDSSESDRRMRADVTWNRTSNRYDPNSTSEQNFTLNGIVTLPEGVRNPSGAGLTVQVEVNVRELLAAGQKVKKPEFSVKNGVTLSPGAEITLTCETEGASIYYTMDGREATRDGQLYTAPIKPTTATTVLRAMAYKEGWQDSDPVKIVVYLDEASINPIDPDDPDDPDVPTPDDVTPEDKEQIGGKTDGLWAVIQDADGREEKTATFAYTGSALKPVVHVYDGTRLLKEKQDYTVSYRNNKNAGGPGASDKYPVVIITGRGNYEGKVEVPFIIKPQSIEDDSVMMDDAVAVPYNKRAQKPSPQLYWNGKKLVNKRDFTFQEVSYTTPGAYKVSVNGIGNYTGTRILNFEIYDGGVSASKFTVSKVPDQKYTGEKITPEVTVKYNDVTLTAGANYDIRYENNLNVGTASAYIIGRGGYKGSKRITFKILPIADMKDVAVAMTFDPKNPTYEGKAVKPVSYTLIYHAKELKEGTDFTVSYLNNDRAGKATAVFTGKGPYKGAVKKTFQISPGSILNASIAMETSYPYQKGGCRPQPRVVLGDRVLVAGTDYTLSYRNNNKIGNTAQVIVKGKGSYAGSVPKYFAVTVQDIKNLKVVAADKPYQQKANVYKTKVEVFDLNGRKLSAGSDYGKEIIYTYATGEKKDQPVLPTDILPLGTRVQVEVRVTAPKLYQGTAYGTYRIVQAEIRNAKVTVLDQEYTGKKVKPNKSQIASITIKGVPLTENDYEIIGYQNNIKQGTAKMTIRGIGDYGGTKEVTFKIKKKGVLNLRF